MIQKGERVELNLEDNMRGTEIILINGYQQASPFDALEHEFTLADSTDNINLNYFYIRYQTNKLYDVSGQNGFNSPI